MACDGFDTMEATAATSEEIFVEPWGFPHKRLGPHRLPPFLSANAVLSMKATWPRRPGNRYMVLPQGFTALDANIDVFVALAEHKNIDHVEKEECKCIRPNFPNFPSIKALPIPSRLQQRVLEFRASQPGIEMPATGPLGHSCFFSKLPPEFHPISSFDSKTMPDIPDEKVAVICADPRYLIMKEVAMLPILAKIMGRSLQDEELRDFFKSSLNQSLDIQNMVAWGRLEQVRPHQVRLFFAEDFVLDPETAFRGLARFLGIDHAETLPTLLERLPDICSKGLFNSCKGPEIEVIEGLTKKFELELAKLPFDVQATWQDQVLNLLSLPNQRLATLGQLVAKHEQWKLPHWWIAHSALLCKPCTFATRGLCRNGNLCGFCHAPDHQRSNRPSKKERQRRDRRRQAMARTPSPAGLSS